MVTSEEIEQIVGTVTGGAANVQDIYPLAPLQEGILFHHLLTSVGDPYLLNTVFRFDSRPRAAAFLVALQAVIDRHDILRTAVVWDGLREPVQVVWRHAQLAVEEIEFDSSAGEVVDQLVARFNPRQYRLDVQRAPLLRVAMARDAVADCWVMVLLTHHLVCDHVTLDEVYREIGVFLRGEGDGLTEPLPFRNLVAQARFGVSREEHESFFSEMLGDVDEPTAPFGLIEVQGDGSGVTRAGSLLDDELSARLRSRARDLGVSVASIAHLAWARVLAALSGRDDVVFGTVLFGRMQGEGSERALGLFINTLPLRLRVDTSGVKESVQRTQALLAQLLGHEHASLALAQRCSGVAAPAPLFSSLLNYRHIRPRSAGVQGASEWEGIEFVGADERTNYPLTVAVNDYGDRLGLTAHAVAAIDPRRICQYMQTALEQLVTALESAPATPVCKLGVLSDAERSRVLVEWNATEAEYPSDRCVHELFEAQAGRTPDAVAVVYEDEQVTYGELNARANRLARHLRSLGVCPDARVALCFERSVEMVVGLLAVLKAGGAYVPLDPSYPIERLSYMVEDSAPCVVLTHGLVAESVHVVLSGCGVPVLLVNGQAELWANASAGNLARGELTAGHLAYVIYTSGSTGAPKGVMVEHRSVCNVLCWSQETYALGPHDVVLQKTPYSFDASIHELLWPLMTGAKLVLARADGHRDATYLAEIIDAQGITVLKLVPSLLHLLLEMGAERCTSLKFVISGGEALRGSVAQRFRECLPGAQLFNMYGPTETTVDVTAWACTSETLPENIPIGRPVANTHIYILDENRQPLPVGVTGDLYIGGVQVARGYLNRPELTAERFVASPFVEGDRLYKTGDAARYLPDGTIEFLGRNDFQVKIRGFRVELGEIEARLAAHESVRDAVVVAREDVPGEKRLVAYYTVRDGAAVSVEELRTHVKATLPEYMVPAAYVLMDSLPLTSNGKLDRKALSAPDGDAYVARAYEEPVGHVEETLARIWSEVLSVDRVGRHDNFFELGGHSLLLMRVIARMRKNGLHADMRTLFAAQTLADVAGLVRRDRVAVEVPPNRIEPGSTIITPEMLSLVDLSEREIEQIVGTVTGGAANVQDIYPLAPLQEGILFHHLLASVGDPYLLNTVYRFDSRTRVAAFLVALQAVIDRHDILRTAVVWDGLREPVQVVWRHAQLAVEEIEFDSSAGEVVDQLVARFNPRQYRLDVQQAPLLRVAMARDAVADCWVMVLLTHHLVRDHVTLDEVYHEIGVFLRGEGDGLAEPLPFRNLVAQARFGVSREEHESFFSEMLGDVDEPTAPFGLIEVQGDGSGVTQAGSLLDDELSARLRSRARDLGVSVASIAHLAWARVLGALSGRDDVVFGTVLFGRMQGEGSERVLGLSINTLPLRLRVDTSGVKESVQQTQALLAQLLGHEHASLALAQRCSGVAAPAPLFSSLLNYRHIRPRDAGVQGANEWEGIEFVGGDERTNYPLMLSVNDYGDRLGLTAQVVAAIDPRRVCQYMQTALEQLVTALESAAATPVCKLGVLSDAERSRVLVEWNATEAEYPSDRCVHELFEAQAGRTPDAVAVVYEDEQVTYGELNARANRLAHHLRGLGVCPDARVVLCLERSVEMVVGVLAVLKAGGAYVPLDPSYPIERLSYMLEDSAPVAVLTHDAVGVPIRAMLAASSTPVIDVGVNASEWSGDGIDSERLALGPEHLAYVMYTSGSTGAPKGVMVEHRNVSNYVAWARSSYVPDSGSIVSSSLSFDATVTSLLVPLAHGSAVRLLSERRELEGLQDCVFQRRDPGLIKITPAHLESLGQQLSTEHLSLTNTFVVGGEALALSTVRIWRDRQPRVRLINEYGPTEATVGCVTYEVPQEVEGLNQVPIGRPIGNVRIYIVDAHGAPAPVGVSGELYIGGAGVARGYLNRPELTAERFIASPFVEGDRLYKTGDVARYLPDGTIEFIGRNDFQVKIRGFRIELGEIEARLAEHESVRDAVVVAREDVPGEKRLVAYYTVRDGAAVSVEELRAHVQATLPEYMVPAAYMVMDSLPLTSNGKLDRKALPSPDGDAYVARAYEEPVGHVEQTIARIWSEVLNVDRVGRHDNFFELGGHSLLAMRVLSRLRRELRVEVSVTQVFAHPVLRDLASVIAEATQSALPAIPPVERHASLALSFAQQRLWFLAQMEGSNYPIPLGLRLSGELDRTSLVKALDGLVARHEPLRTTFAVMDGLPVQRIAGPESGFTLVDQDLSGRANAADELKRLQIEEASAPFDLEMGPLIRGRLIRLGDTEHVLLITMHHIVSDAWSMGILMRELSALYGAYREGRMDPLPALEIQYADYAAWQRRHLSGDVLQEQTSYWQRTLAGIPAVHKISTDRARPSRQDHTGAVIGFRLDARLTDGLRALSLRHGTTLFTTLLTAWGIVLGRLSGETDVVIGTSVANRTRTEIEGLIGFFVNTLALRLDLSGNPSAEELLDRVKVQTLAAQEHQDVPFEQVVEVIQPPRSLAHTPVFQVMFVWQNNEGGRFSAPGLDVSSVAVGSPVSKFDLTLTLSEFGDRIVGRLEYATALFDGSTIERYLGYLRAVVEALVADALQSIDRVALLSDAERARVLVEWNATGAEYPSDRCVHELFEAQAGRTPDAVAVVYEDEQVTYGELNARANRLARHLRNLGVCPDARVVLCLERSVEMVVGVLAVLKAGGAYVPLDPSYPLDRLSYMLEDSAPVAVLTHDAVRVPVRAMLAASSTPVIDVGVNASGWSGDGIDSERLALGPEHLAYVMYTSGSTGAPKGVMVEHRNVSNYVAWARSSYMPDSGSIVSSSLSFDATVTSLLVPLAHGSVVRLLSERRELEGLQDCVFQRHDPGLIKITPAHFESLGQQLSTEHLSLTNTFVVGGEALALSTVRIWRDRQPRVRLINEYGPTEATVGCVTYEVPQEVEGLNQVPIGRPIGNVRIYIVDAHGAPAPVGVSGELYIGGAGVARGYLNRPELTAERFIASPFVEGDRLYKTGDVARYLPDGTIEFLGRNDFQVKIRGFRIELGEIEARLAEHESVRDAVVVAREDVPGEKRLVAYYTVRDGAAVSVEELRAHVQATLPEYMVPAAYMVMDSLPLTSNGKLDRKALPSPDGDAYVARAYEEPVGHVEQTIARIWSEVLNVDRVGRHDNFFELGGHSLLLLRAIARMRKNGLHADIHTLFAAQTLTDVALVARRDRVAVEVPPNRIEPGSTIITPEMLSLVDLSEREIEQIVGTVTGGAANVQDIYPLAPLQEGILFHHLLTSVGDPYLLNTVYRFDSRTRVAAFLVALQAVIDRHDILRTAVVWDGLREPVQVVWRHAQLAVEEIEFDSSAGEVVDQLVARFNPRQYRLDVQRAPLLRVAMARDAVADHWVMVLLSHHLVSDHVTLDEVYHEIRVFLRGEGDGLPEPLPFRNLVAQARFGVSREEHESFFSEMLGDVDELTAPFGLIEVQGDGSGATRAGSLLDDELSARLRSRARDLGVSVASIAHLAWARVLGALSGRDDVVFGTVLFGRMQGEGSERALGLFINTLPLRLRVDTSGVKESVQQTQALLAQLLGHEHASLALAQRCSGVAAPAPLFSSLLNYRHIRPRSAGAQGASRWEGIEVIGAEDRTTYPLILSVNDYGDRLGLTAHAVAAIDPRRVCQYMQTALEQLVTALESAPATPVCRLGVLSDAERARVLVEWNATEAEYPSDRCVHELFEAQAERTPDAVAVVYEDEQVTYDELNARANRLARHLHGLGVGPDTRVALCVERSVEMVVGLLAVLKAGGAYVPLDPSYPIERLKYMLQDSAPIAVLTHGTIPSAVGQMMHECAAAVIDMNGDVSRWADESGVDLDVAVLTSRHLAYVIYTSGSTGDPKGVMVEHAGVCNLAQVQADRLDIDSSSRILQFASLSFDASIFEVIQALCHGASLHLTANGTPLVGSALAHVISDRGITHVLLPPAVLSALSPETDLAPVRVLVVGGDAVTEAIVKRWARDRRLVNAYGPTESTVLVTLYDCKSEHQGNPPIGRPISNARLYILDAHAEPVPVGVAGELHIGGESVARGYLNRPELTAERFIASPFVDGDRLYKTGDLARYRADGTIEFLGRNDFQVKIRGFRIELGEIEAALMHHPSVYDAAVLAREDVPGERRLIAFYTSREGTDVLVEDLRRHLLAMLPEHMVPVAYVHLDVFPLTPNGKTDRRHLRASYNETYVQRAYEPPVGEAEEIIARIWSEVLGIEMGRIGRNDDFFDLGGHSLLAVRLLSRIHRELQVDVGLTQVFKHSVFLEMARVISTATRGALPAIRRVNRESVILKV